MISPEIMRGYVDVLVLEALLDEPSYGYAISGRIESLSQGQYEMKETTLYSALRRLERSEFVRSFKGKSETGRARTYYEITEAGRKLYRDRVGEWFATGELIARFVRPEHTDPNDSQRYPSQPITVGTTAGPTSEK